MISLCTDLMNCEQHDKLLGSNNLDFGKTDSLENIVMMVARNDIITCGSNGTINKFVIVRISSDEIEAESWVDEFNKGRRGEKVQQTFTILPAVKREEDFLIFQEDRR